jgi:hypothetical protein
MQEAGATADLCVYTTFTWAGSCAVLAQTREWLQQLDGLALHV